MLRIHAIRRVRCALRWPYAALRDGLGSPRSLAATLALLLALAFGGTLSASEATPTPPFQPPLADPPSYETWFLAQTYGNTSGAYRARNRTYSAGQGIHFGLDFSTRCGTPVLAIGDGTVYAIDGPFGSAPHTVVIAHPNGYFSLYGHLRVRTTHLQIGQEVKAGDVVGESGDSVDEVRCDMSPHLHLEIRTDGMTAAVNPIPLIDAPWWDDASLGLSFSQPTFEVDLEAPRRWQSLYDQPSIRFGGYLLNDYLQPWPR
ncbi:MAG: M23 family metallopeptidase [Chloroflexota bacterium]|jgi:murein DD-endopeptidase MepM/ murein hydrolase activator NlpD|nr:M23 family metallopeptidase [Chloroflexota bacterium]MDP6509095.1 M23 family metallopeptidase [Chloroflexota bacterium]MDP6758267.1 M23 family metallopeptidase [Chloroflexota bacterium]